MLSWRIAISCILIPLLLAIFYFDAKLGSQAPLLGLLCMILALRSSWELQDLLRTRSLIPARSIVMTGSVVMILAAWLPHLIGSNVQGTMFAEFGPLGLAFSLYVCVALVFEAIRFREPGATSENLGALLLIVAYCGVLLGATAQLRWVAGADAGYLVLGSLLIGVKGGDIGGYTLGRLFGKRKMAPRLSPGKTWAGAVGACLAASLGVWAWLTWMPRHFDPNWKASPAVWSLLYGLTLGVVGLAGDLCESLIKRDVGRKDAAALFPGFGGLLDLLDSVVYAGPVAYLFWRFAPLAAGLHV
jgi:phosphatidate cytidylyltransferase